MTQPELRRLYKTLPGAAMRPPPSYKLQDEIIMAEYRMALVGEEPVATSTEGHADAETRLESPMELIAPAAEPAVEELSDVADDELRAGHRRLAPEVASTEEVADKEDIFNFGDPRFWLAADDPLLEQESLLSGSAPATPEPGEPSGSGDASGSRSGSLTFNFDDRCDRYFVQTEAPAPAPAAGEGHSKEPSHEELRVAVRLATEAMAKHDSAHRVAKAKVYEFCREAAAMDLDFSNEPASINMLDLIHEEPATERSALLAAAEAREALSLAEAAAREAHAKLVSGIRVAEAKLDACIREAAVNLVLSDEPEMVRIGFRALEAPGMTEAVNSMLGLIQADSGSPRSLQATKAVTVLYQKLHKVEANVQKAWKKKPHMNPVELVLYTLLRQRRDAQEPPRYGPYPAGTQDKESPQEAAPTEQPALAQPLPAGLRLPHGSPFEVVRPGIIVLPGLLQADLDQKEILEELLPTSSALKTITQKGDPRKVGLFPYRCPGWKWEDALATQSVSDVAAMLKIFDAVSRFGVDFNHGIFRCHSEGKAYVIQHANKWGDLKGDSWVLVLSLAECGKCARTFEVSQSDDPDNVIWSKSLPPGTVVLVNAEGNKLHKISVAKAPKCRCLHQSVSGSVTLRDVTSNIPWPEVREKLKKRGKEPDSVPNDEAEIAEEEESRDAVTGDQAQADGPGASSTKDASKCAPPSPLAPAASPSHRPARASASIAEFGASSSSARGSQDSAPAAVGAVAMAALPTELQLQWKDIKFISQGQKSKNKSAIETGLFTKSNAEITSRSTAEMKVRQFCQGNLNELEKLDVRNTNDVCKAAVAAVKAELQTVGGIMHLGHTAVQMEATLETVKEMLAEMHDHMGLKRKREVERS